MDRRSLLSFLGLAPVAIATGAMATQTPNEYLKGLSAKNANMGESVAVALYDPREANFNIGDVFGPEKEFWRAAYRHNAFVWGTLDIGMPHGELPQRAREFADPLDAYFVKAINGRLHVHNVTRNTFASLPYSGLVTA